MRLSVVLFAACVQPSARLTVYQYQQLTGMSFMTILHAGGSVLRFPCKHVIVCQNWTRCMPILFYQHYPASGTVLAFFLYPFHFNFIFHIELLEEQIFYAVNATEIETKLNSYLTKSVLDFHDWIHACNINHIFLCNGKTHISVYSKSYVISILLLISKF